MSWCGCQDAPRKVKNGRANGVLPAQSQKCRAQSESFPAQTGFSPRKMEKRPRKPEIGRAKWNLARAGRKWAAQSESCLAQGGNRPAQGGFSPRKLNGRLRQPEGSCDAPSQQGVGDALVAITLRRRGVAATSAASEFGFNFWGSTALRRVSAPRRSGRRASAPVR